MQSPAPTNHSCPWMQLPASSSPDAERATPNKGDWGAQSENVTNATETSDPVAVFVEEPTRVRPEERLGTNSNLRSLQGSVRNQSLVTSSGSNHWKTHPEHTNWDHHPVGVMDWMDWSNHAWYIKPPSSYKYIYICKWSHERVFDSPRTPRKKKNTVAQTNVWSWTLQIPRPLHSMAKATLSLMHPPTRCSSRWVQA